MSAQVTWTLLLTGCVVGLALGKIHKPLYLKVESRNFSLFLTWLPNPENPPTAAYQVRYIVGYKADEENRWKTVPTCKNITVPVCDLTCVLMEERYLQHTVRVRAVSQSRGNRSLSSPWVELGNISYIFTVEPAPPILHLMQGENNLSINASVPSPSCMPRILSQSLKYSVEVTRDKTLQQVIQEQPMDGSAITIKTHGYKGEYCFAAKTKYVMDTIKISPLSNPMCKFFIQKEDSHNTWLLVGITVAVAFIISVTTIFYAKLKKTTNKNKTPKALDFQCKASTLPWFLENEHKLTKYDQIDDVSSVSLVQYSEVDASDKDYPFNGCSYLQRCNREDNLNNMLQTDNSAHREYMSSNGGSNSDTTSGSNTGISVTLDKMQINEVQQDINIIVSDGIQTLSPTNDCMRHLFNSPIILNSNDLGNVKFDTLCIADNEQQDTSDDESSNQLLTDSEDCTEQGSIDITDSDIPYSNRTTKDGKPQMHLSSGYEQRSNMTRRY